MARNMYPGTCYECGKHVPAGYGHFERYRGRWRVKCVKCASGRIVTEDDPCVIAVRKRAKRREKEALKDDKGD